MYELVFSLSVCLLCHIIEDDYLVKLFLFGLHVDIWYKPESFRTNMKGPHIT